ncbi:MAG: imidazole glycerol phosphate synthase cyclase subunit [Patescibacteria group bacterium]|jgi:cyclase
MKNIRIIPRLDIKGPNVVKPVHTEALRVVGDPKTFVKRYDAEGADEIMYLDIVASLYQRNLDFDLLKTVTENVFIPVTAGGGIRTIQDINFALRSGADKVAINTHAIRHPEFLDEAVREFGSQCIVLSVEAKRRPDGSYEAYTDGGREPTGLDVLTWVGRGIERGVGELLITSIDRDGTEKGFELDLLTRIAQIAPIPVIVHGGAGSLESIEQAVTIGNADAVAISSIFHFGTHSIRDVKSHLAEHGFAVRNV